MIVAKEVAPPPAGTLVSPPSALLSYLGLSGLAALSGYVALKHPHKLHVSGPISWGMGGFCLQPTLQVKTGQSP